MLKRVQTDQIELGMFIHKLEGSWFSHAFWKSRFLLDDPEMLENLRESAVAGVIIDTERGIDLSEPAVTVDSATLSARIKRAAAPAAARAVAPVPQRTGFVRPTPAMPIAREFGRAKRTVGDALKVVSRTFIEMRLGKSIRSYGVEPMLDNVYASVQRNLYAFNGLLRCQSDSEPVYRHSLAVSALMIALASHLRFSPADIRDAGMAGLLMDVGAGQLPVDLATVGGDYTLLRQELREQHVLHGYTFLKAAGDIPDDVLRAVLQHHERLDGSGYPQRLTGPVIDQLGRMAAICDTYDTLISGGDPAQRLDPAEAITRLRDQPEKFDATLVARFVETVGIYPIGSFVRLRSQRLAMVVDEDPVDTGLPTVRTFWSLPQGKGLKGETIELANCYGEDAIEGVADLAGLDLPDVARLRESLLKAACKEASQAGKG
ncbi:MAG: DUF3391 domain-containing protein [Novosphingobium sp.]|nr:DUF3391 domain-containing protein [Novosphingobium sp.]